MLLNVRARSKFCFLRTYTSLKIICHCSLFWLNGFCSKFIFCFLLQNITIFTLIKEFDTEEPQLQNIYYIFILYSPEYLLWTGVKIETVAQLFVIDNLQTFDKFDTKVTCICFRACTAICTWFPTSQDSVSDKALTIL